MANADIVNLLLAHEADARLAVPTQMDGKGDGANPEQLFAGAFIEHLARLQLADLALDTLPYNAHTTASDALWVGVPLISCTGDTFPSRVAGSLLHAVDMAELVVQNLGDYYEIALSIALDPLRLLALRQKLANERDQAALYDVATYTQALEALYQTMWTRQRDGLAPCAIGAGAVDEPRIDSIVRFD